ncbi:unnamed protein product [Colias eurytheme]|nr:unnamed protein product [Colias eurytheme]
MLPGAARGAPFAPRPPAGMGVPRVSSTAPSELELGRARRPHLLIVDDSREARLSEARMRPTSLFPADLDPEVGQEQVPRTDLATIFRHRLRMRHLRSSATLVEYSLMSDYVHIFG